MTDVLVSATATAPQRAVTGLLDEYRALQAQLSEQPGLLTIRADPWSGTSALLPTALDGLEYSAILADARPCATVGELAQRIASAAIASRAPQASRWWEHRSLSDTDGLRLGHALHRKGLDAERLRQGDGPDSRLLADALRMACVLGDGPTLVAVDHLDRLLDRLEEKAARECLEVMRAVRQALADLQLLLIGRPQGPVQHALQDPEHPLYRAGQSIDIRRPVPRRFIDDASHRELSTTGVASDLLGAAAELAAGVPFLTWQIIDLAADEGAAPQRALHGWRRLRALTDAQTGQSFDLLARAHPLAQQVVAAISIDGQPYKLAANNKRISDALARLRQLGVAFQPRERTWALASPLLLEWARDHWRQPARSRSLYAPGDR